MKTLTIDDKVDIISNEILTMTSYVYTTETLIGIMRDLGLDDEQRLQVLEEVVWIAKEVRDTNGT